MRKTPLQSTNTGLSNMYVYIRGCLGHVGVMLLACSVLQCVAVYFSLLQCVAPSVGHLGETPFACSALQCVAVCCSVLQCVAVCCSVLQCITVCCSVCVGHSDLNS